MRYKIHTAPIWDAFKEGCACPLCRIENNIATKLVQQYLNEACMEPSYRVELNRLGLCTRHATEMLDGAKLATALQLSTRTATIKDALAKPNKKNCVKEAEKILNGQDSCVICDNTKKNMSTYYETIAVMFNHENDFESVLNNLEGFCVRHYAFLLKNAKHAGAKTDDYLTLLHKIQNNLLGKIKSNLNSFAEIFDYKKGGTPTEEIRETPTIAINIITEK